MLTISDNLLPADGDARLYTSVFTAAEADTLFEQLLYNTHWKQDSMPCFGKQVALPRLTAWYGEEGKYYRYSGIDNVPLAWNHLLLDIKNYIVTLPGMCSTRRC